MLTRIQNFIEISDQKINEIQVRFNKLSDIFNRYDVAQCELELLDDTDHTADRELFENQYFQVEAKFNELLLWTRHQESIRLAAFLNTATVFTVALLTLNYLQSRCQPLTVTRVVGCTFATPLKH